MDQMSYELSKTFNLCVDNIFYINLCCLYKLYAVHS